MTPEEEIKRNEEELKQLSKVKDILDKEHYEKMVNLRLDRILELKKEMK